MGTDWHQGLFSPLEGEEVRLRGEGVVLQHTPRKQASEPRFKPATDFRPFEASAVPLAFAKLLFLFPWSVGVF